VHDPASRPKEPHLREATNQPSGFRERVSREQTSFPSAPLPLNIIFTIAFPRSVGQVTKVANGVIYFPGTQQITDPSVAAVISANGLNSNFTNKAITDAKGNLLFVNPAPG